jgi:hypothetical protein
MKGPDSGKGEKYTRKIGGENCRKTCVERKWKQVILATSEKTANNRQWTIGDMIKGNLERDTFD